MARISNKVADALSRWYSSNDESIKYDQVEYVSADIKLDPDQEDLSWDRVIELHTKRIQEDHED
jgi:hypothetical protein